MNKKAILAALLVAASSTAALADNVTVRDHRDVDAQYMQNHKRLPVWSVLSSQDQLSNGKAKISLSSWKKFSELKLEATKGNLDISRVQIKFADGQTQVLQTNADLSPQSPALTINLDGARSIKSIQVFGSSGRRAAFEILGA